MYNLQRSRHGKIFTCTSHVFVVIEPHSWNAIIHLKGYTIHVIHMPCKPADVLYEYNYALLY